MQPYPDRVMLLACSDRKRPIHGTAPALKVYDGPLHRDLRQALAAWGKPKRAAFVFPFVLFLSAKYGFIVDNAPIERYDQVLTPARADELLADPKALEALRVTGTDEILLAGGKLYRQTMRRALELVRYRGIVVEPTPARGIGDIRVAMQRFIEASPRLIARV